MYSLYGSLKGFLSTTFCNSTSKHDTTLPKIIVQREYDDFATAIVKDDTVLNHGQWLPTGVLVPQISVCVSRRNFSADKELAVHPVKWYCDVEKSDEVINKVPYYYILVNDAFLNHLSDAYQYTLIQHELAHIRHGDVPMLSMDDRENEDMIAVKERLADIAVVEMGLGQELVDTLTYINITIINVAWKRKANQSLQRRITYVKQCAIPMVEVKKGMEKCIDVIQQEVKTFYAKCDEMSKKYHGQ